MPVVSCLAPSQFIEVYGIASLHLRWNHEPLIFNVVLCVDTIRGRLEREGKFEEVWRLIKEHPDDKDFGRIGFLLE